MKFLFVQNKYDPSSYVKRTDKGNVVILVYVDDIFLTGESLKLIEDTKSTVQ